MPSPTYTVAVRALCEFAARRGDLDFRFARSPTSQEGIAGHRSVTARRSPAYRSEIALNGAYRHLVVRGRADGFDPATGRLEEIKTFKGDLDRTPANHRSLHWAQAKVYGWLLCRQLELAELTVALVYFDIGRQREAPPLAEHCTAAQLQHHFESICARFIAWADEELAHRTRRDAALSALHFPHATFRAGQRPLAEAVFNGARLGRSLMAQAPTGIGKTIGTIFPLLKACPGQALDKVFFLTAKNSGRAVALNALEAIHAGASAPRLRVLELVARDKACEHPTLVCHGESCPLARGFYDRLPAARAAAAGLGSLTRAGLRDVALAHAVCPYHLGQEMARWCDVIVGDYNHYFDNSALLHGLTLANGWRVAVLVDEAHNLVDRARGMYSAALDSAVFGTLRESAPIALKKPLDRLHRAWTRLAKSQTRPYTVHTDPPQPFAVALKDAVAALTTHLADSPAGSGSDLLGFYFEALQFVRLLESFGTHSMFDVTLALAGARGRIDSTLCIRNVVPAPFLKPRFAAARSSVLFSATLAPQHFYADTLGLPDDVAWLDVAAPFDPRQLAVHVVHDVSTRFSDRENSLAPIARLIAAQYETRPGNYLAYFSSFDYLQRAAEVFAARFPNIPMWQQRRRMDESARDDFLARFAADGRGIGFAVLGGSFAEGIDLPGTRLIGALIATLGLPQFNAVNEEMRRRLEAEFGAGYEYAYLYPGLRKVVQAAGRVIRTLSDRGSLHLIDDRFARPEVARLLPAWWHIQRAGAGSIASARGHAPEHQVLNPE